MSERGDGIKRRSRNGKQSAMQNVAIEAIVANAPMGICVTDARVVSRYNHSFAKIIGVVSDELVGRDLTSIFPNSGCMNWLREQIHALYEVGDMLHSRSIVKRLDGAIVDAEITGYAIDPASPRMGAVWVLRRLPPLVPGGESYGRKIGTSETLPSPYAACSSHQHDKPPVLDEPALMISGIDVALGLRRASGKKDLYIKLLGHFLSSQMRVVHDMSMALTASNFELAARLVHALKGAAANIGAIDLADMASELDDAIRKTGHGKQTKLRMMALDAALAELCRHLAVVLPPTERDRHQVPSKNTAFIELLARIEAKDSEALAYFETNAESFRGVMSRKDFEVLSLSLSFNDFAGARGVLEAANHQANGRGDE